MSSRPETGRNAWTDSFEFRIAKELGLMNPGIAKCLKCGEMFNSEDTVYNRICPHCKELNYDISTNENCEGEFLYIESFDGKRGLEERDSFSEITNSEITEAEIDDLIRESDIEDLSLIESYPKILS